MMNKKRSKYGIGITKWCKEHERFITESIEGDLRSDDLTGLLALHEKKLSWLMHERIVHLIVLFITVIIVLFSLALLVFLPDFLYASMPLFLLSFILLVFYVRHYFFLENTVQYWYKIDEDITGMIENGPDKENDNG